MGKIKKRRQVVIHPLTGIVANYEMARIAEERILKYRRTRDKKLRRELFRNFYPARLGVFTAVYKRYDLPIKDIKAVVDETFYWLVDEGYKPKDENSRFAGFIHLCFIYYCLARLRTSLKETRRKLIRLNDKKVYVKNTCLPVDDLKYMMVKSRLSRNEKQVLRGYFIKRFTSAMIAKKMMIAESTVRNTKRQALLKIKALNTKWHKALTARPTLMPVLNAYLRRRRLRRVKAPDIFVNEQTHRGLQLRRMKGLQ